MGANLVEIHDGLEKRRTFGWFDDFSDFSSGGRWTSTTAGSATVVASTSVSNGILVLSNVDSTANRQTYVATTNSLFLIANNKPQIFEVMLQWTEANTNQAAVVMGFMNSVAAGAIVNGGLTLKTNFSGACIFKPTGSNSYQTVSSIGTTQTITNTDVGTATINTYGWAGGSNQQRLRVEIKPVSSTICEVSYWVDYNAANPGSGFLQLRDSTTRKNLIKDFVTYTGAVQMQAFFGILNGSTSPETLNVDYAAYEQLR
jgi:hypothetical protein